MSFGGQTPFYMPKNTQIGILKHINVIENPSFPLFVVARFVALKKSNEIGHHQNSNVKCTVTIEAKSSSAVYNTPLPHCCVCA